MFRLTRAIRSSPVKISTRRLFSTEQTSSVGYRLGYKLSPIYRYCKEHKIAVIVVSLVGVNTWGYYNQTDPQLSTPGKYTFTHPSGNIVTLESKDVTVWHIS